MHIGPVVNKPQQFCIDDQFVVRVFGQTAHGLFFFGCQGNGLAVDVYAFLQPHNKGVVVFRMIFGQLPDPGRQFGLINGRGIQIFLEVICIFHIPLHGNSIG